MTTHQLISSTLIAFVMVFIIFYLVRKRRLREDYALIWIAYAILMTAVIYFYPLLVLMTKAIGAVTPTTTLFIFGFIFLLLLNLKITISLSKLERHVKKLTQKITLLEARLEEQWQGSNEIEAKEGQ